jgi:hypothetical protein
MSEQSKEAKTSASNVVDKVTLGALIGVVDTNTQALIRACGGSRGAIDLILGESSGLANYIKSVMGEALTPEDADLVAKTALVTHQVVRAIPVPLDYSSSDDQKNGGKSDQEDMLIAMEDSVYEVLKSKNDIWISLKDNMVRVPDLALFITGKMRSTIDLEDANLVGATALLIYKTENMFPNLFSDKNKEGLM